MTLIRLVDGRPHLVLDAASARQLEQLANLAIRRMLDESARGWAPSPDLAELLRSLRDVQIATNQLGPIAVHGSAIDTPPDPLASCHSVSETAQLLDLGERRVRQLATSAKLRARQLPEGVWIVDRRSIDERLLGRTLSTRRARRRDAEPPDTAA